MKDAYKTLWKWAAANRDLFVFYLTLCETSLPSEIVEVGSDAVVQRHDCRSLEERNRCGVSGGVGGSCCQPMGQWVPPSPDRPLSESYKGDLPGSVLFMFYFFNFPLLCSCRI